MADVFDLWIDNNDLVLGSDDEPRYLNNAAAIAQDIKHRIRESGLVPKLVGARGNENRSILQQIKLVAKEEERVKPETVAITELTAGHFQVTAETLDNLFITVAL